MEVNRMLFETTSEEQAHAKYTAEDRMQAYLNSAEMFIESERAALRCIFRVRTKPLTG